MDAVLFDLDQTLVNSARLVEARREQKWGAVLSRLDEIELYEGRPHELPQRLRSLGIRTGIVSRGARPYVEAVLERFGIVADVVVTGSDGFAHKPDPAGLQHALSQLGVVPEKAAYVGDDEFDFEAAAQAGMKSIGALWSYANGIAPPVWLPRWPDLAFRFSELLEEPQHWDLRAPLAEVTVLGLQPKTHRGSVLPYGKGLSLGRYFKRSDQRAAHELSQAIVRNKDQSPDASAFARAVELVCAAWPVIKGAGVTSMPGDPADRLDRFAAVRAAAASAVGGADEPHLLKQLFGVEEYKRTHGSAERDALNAGRFAATRAPSRDVVLLIDDVFTTGSQLRACRTVLLEAGAQNVYTITLAHAQTAFLRSCPMCGGVLKYSVGSRGPFWGCSRWRRDGSGCPYTEDA